MGKTTQYYKKAITRALNARENIGRINAEYERQCKIAKDMLEADMLGEAGYKEKIAEHKRDRDEKIEDALGCIDSVGAEYVAEMRELMKIDGSRIDDGVMKLLNSGIRLTTAEWQELADAHKASFLTTRLLKEKYNEAKSNEGNEGIGPFGFLPGHENSGLGAVRFGQSPQDRAEKFSRFTQLLHYNAVSDTMPNEGNMAYASKGDYWNHCARESIKGMQPFGDESFDTLERDFPVETVAARPTFF